MTESKSIVFAILNRAKASRFVEASTLMSELSEYEREQVMLNIDHLRDENYLSVHPEGPNGSLRITPDGRRHLRSLRISRRIGFKLPETK